MIYTKAKYNNDVTTLEEENLLISKTAATEGIVLLKNDGTLPLKEKKIALFGVGVSNTVYGGSGSGEVKTRHNVSILEGLENSGFNITTRKQIDEYNKLYLEKKEEYLNRKKKEFNIFKISAIMSMLGEDFEAPLEKILSKDEIIKLDTKTCIYVLSRQSGEAKDRELKKGDYYLTDNEKKMIETLSVQFEKFILILNTPSSIDMKYINSIKEINAIIYMSLLGCMTGYALSEILEGKVSPSGKLTNTWVKDYKDIPNNTNFKNHINYDYTESIYVGYKYYDTFGIDVTYPFGYGLSYTDFLISVNNIDIKKNIIKVNTKIKNIGNYLGKEVIQLYISIPSDKLKQPKKILVDFNKTKVLNLLEEEFVSLEFDILDFASYDEKILSYVLEKGIYVLYIGNSVNNLKPICNLILEETIIRSVHQNICYKEHLFDEIVYMNDNSLLNIDTYKLELLNDDIVKYKYDTQISYEKDIYNFVKTLKTKEMINIIVGDGMFINNPKFNLPGSVGNTTSKLYKKGLVNVAFCDGPQGLRLQKVSGIRHNKKIKPIEQAMALFELFPKFIKKILNADPKKDTLVYQYTTSFPIACALAQTWNKELVKQVGVAIGKEMLEYGCTFWLAPAINIQLNPLCGRNYEYLSEDPFLTGTIASNIILGVQSFDGIYATVKHFACNNQETNREFVSANINERTLRDIYLKPFEMAIKKGKAKALMTSYNKINDVYVTNDYNMCTNVLRYEWNFDGVVMTDWFSTRGKQADNVQAIKAGTNLIMPGLFTMAKRQIRRALIKKQLSKEELINATYYVVKAIISSQIQKEYKNLSSH